MKYKHKSTGRLVEPSCDVAEQTFARSGEWEKVVEKSSKSEGGNGKAEEVE